MLVEGKFGCDGQVTTVLVIDMTGIKVTRSLKAGPFFFKALTVTPTRHQVTVPTLVTPLCGVHRCAA